MGEFLVWALMLDRGGSAGFVRTYLAIIRAPNFFERRIGRGCRRGRDWAVRPSVLPFSHFVPRTSSTAILLSLQFCTAHYVIWRSLLSASARARLLEAEAARFNSAEMQLSFPGRGRRNLRFRLED